MIVAGALITPDALGHGNPNKGLSLTGQETGLGSGEILSLGNRRLHEASRKRPARVLLFGDA